MSTTSQVVSGVNTGILLEAGTNEVEVLIFFVGDLRYGVNVAKVREVLVIDQVTAIPESHSAIDGMVRIRDEVVMLVNLGKYLDGENLAEGFEEGKQLLLLEFNEQLIAFRVTGVDRIVRASWNQSSPMPELMGVNAPVTSVLLIEDKMLSMLDFESIGASIGLNKKTARYDEEIKRSSQGLDKATLPIVVAEDSRMISEMILDELNAAGFEKVTRFPDGHEAWLYLENLSKDATPETIHQQVAAIVSDIEMPMLDGLNLTSRVRKNEVLKNIPVILFSSLVSNDNKKKGLQVGADAQVSKPHYDELIKTLLAALQGELRA